MSKPDERPGIFVVSGTQGAGKTTVSTQLAMRFAHGAYISGDAMQKMIVSGRVWPDASQVDINNEVEGEAAAQLRLRLQNMCLLGRSFYEAGFTVVLDDIVIGRRLTELREELAGREFMFVMLHPSLEVVREREAGRGTELWREWEWLTESIERTTERVGLWLDTSRLTAEETVDEIMARAWTEAVVRA